MVCTTPLGSSQLCREDISLKDGCRTAEMKTCLEFFPSFRAVRPIVQRCKNRESSYVLRRKKSFIQEEKERKSDLHTLLQRMVIDYRT